MVGDDADYIGRAMAIRAAKGEFGCAASVDRDHGSEGQAKSYQ